MELELSGSTHLSGLANGSLSVGPSSTGGVDGRSSPTFGGAESSEAVGQVAFDGSQRSSGGLEHTTERALFEYLIDAEKAAGPMTDLHGIASGALQSIGAAIQGAQKVFALNEKSILSSNSDVGQNVAATQNAEKASDYVGLDSEAMDKLLQHYVDVTWASFQASLAVNSVSAATSSINSLVKQQ